MVNIKHPLATPKDTHQTQHDYLQEIWDPQRVEEVPCASFLFAVVLPQVDKVEDIIMPRLKVDSEGPWAFVASLVDVASNRVVGTEHRYNTV
jgi:hypothetical protein